MSKILTSAMRAHLDAETTRLAAIWRITRKDGAQFFFTDHDRDIVFGGDTYRADAGFERTKDKSTERIDGIVATIMAIGRAMVVQEEPRSVYERRGILTL